MPRCPLKFFFLPPRPCFFSQFPHHTLDSSHIQCMYNKLSWVSVPLHFLPQCLGNTCTTFHLVIHVLQVAQASTRVSLLKSTLPPPPCHQTMINASPLYHHSPVLVCVLWTNSSHKWKDKFTITLLLFLPYSLSTAVHHFLVSSYSPGPTCTSLLVLFEGHRQ